MDPEKEIEKLVIQNKLMQFLITDLGFFISYYEVNKINNNKNYSFDEVNRIYKELFGRTKYHDLNDFFKNGFRINMN